MSIIVFYRRIAAYAPLRFDIKKFCFAAGVLFPAITAGASTAKATTAVGQKESGIFDMLFSDQPEPMQQKQRHRPQRHRRLPQSSPYASGAPVVASSQSSAILAEAQRWVGHGNVTGTHRAWCADFANWILTRTGHRASGSGMVNSLLGVGPRVASPSPGDLVVMRSHVTIFAGFGGRGFYGLGGNQHHRVAMSNYPLRSVVAYVRPN